MKIASVYDFKAFPPRGGNHLHALQLIRQFQSAGHDVLTWGDDTVPGVRAFPRDKAGAAALCAAADVLYVRFDGNHVGKDPLLVDLLESCNKPTVWEINSPADENLAFSWLGGETARPLDHTRRLLHAWRQYPGIWAEDRLRRRLAARAFAATCVSADLARYARESLGLARVVVNANAADPETHRPDGPVATLSGADPGRLRVLYAGSPIYPWQGADLVRETAELCRTRGDPFLFVMLLNQEPPRAMEGPNVVVFKSVPHQEVSHYIRACDLALTILCEMPWSNWGSYFSPMKLFDYMACGRPIVGSNVGQLKEVIEPGRNGWLFDNTPAGLRDVLVEAASHRSDLPRMGIEARRDVESSHNWRQVGAATLSLLQAARQVGTA